MTGTQLSAYAREWQPQASRLGTQSLPPLRTDPLGAQEPSLHEPSQAAKPPKPPAGQPAEAAADVRQPSPPEVPAAQPAEPAELRQHSQPEAGPGSELDEADFYAQRSASEASSAAEDRPDRPAGPGPQSAQAGGSRSTLRASSLPGSISSRLLGTSASEDDFSRQCSLALPPLEPGRPSTPLPDACSRPQSPDPDLKIGPGDFDLMRVVGQGAFGKVFQVRLKSTGRVYAMKVMRKDRVLERDHGDYIKAERDVLTAVLHPYIVALRYSFQTSTKLYLVLDFINGGHLFFQLYRQGIFNEDLARLYTAEIVLAISHLHSLNFVHRDLKPENVLLDKDGHIKVTDFGLAKGNMNADGRTNSFIGTMEYMAPEIISGMGHGKAVDWWSVGILLYEMLCGMPPFKAKGRKQLQAQITTAKLKLPPYLSADAQSLLRALLQKEAPKRLGYGEQGSAQVQAHPFFRSISWHLLMQQRVKSPFKPSCSSQDSVENFDRVWTDQAPEDSPCSSPVKGRTSSGSAIFEGFTYSAPSVLASLAAEPSRLLAS